MTEPGDLLHEAGHIALMSTIERQSTSGNVMADKEDHNSAELGAILWSYAALKHLNIAPEVVFHNHGYLEDSEWLINSLESGEYIGLSLLEWNSLTDAQTFPKMHRWVSQR